MYNWFIIFFVLFLVVGLFLFVLSVASLVKKNVPRDERVLKAATFSFLANWVLLIPSETLRGSKDSFSALDAVSSLFSSLIKSFGVYFGNGLDDLVSEEPRLFFDIYALIQLIVGSFLVMIAAGTIIGFFDGPVQYFSLFRGRKKKAIIFNACNKKTLSIVQGALKTRENVLPIFTGVSDELDSEDKKQIKEMKGIFMKSSIRYALEKIKRHSPYIEVFLFSDDEMTNLEQTGAVLDVLKGENGPTARIYVQLDKTPGGVYDGILSRYGFSEAQERVTINFIRVEENCIYNLLYRTSIFEHAVDSNDYLKIEYDSDDENTKKENDEVKPRTEQVKIKDIHALIVGYTSYTLEMLKALLHLGQMPGYRLHVALIDEEDHIGRIRKSIPELEFDVERTGDAFYHFRYERGIDFSTSQLDELVDEKYSDFTYVFVQAGDDIQSLDIAMRINAIGFRHKRNLSYRIQAFLFQMSTCDRWNPDLIPGIEPIGGLDWIYSYELITMSDIEKASIAIHKVRYSDKKPWAVYCNNEYNRHSVYARTLSFHYKVAILKKDYHSDFTVSGRSVTWRLFEHMRWDMYTRVTGYSKDSNQLLKDNDDKKVRALARVHKDLILFDDLPQKEKDKDALKLTDEIVKCLEM